MLFTVINPRIVGSFSKAYEGNTAEEAGAQFWEALTTKGKYVLNNIPSFGFTLQEGGSKNLVNLLVKETINGNHSSYTISKIDLNLSETDENNIINASQNAYNKALKIANTNQHTGGKKKHRKYKDDSSSSSSSSDSSDDVDDLFRSIRIKSVAKPIVYWWYAPSMYKIENLFTPTFVPAVAPLYTELWIPVLP